MARMGERVSALPAGATSSASAALVRQRLEEHVRVFQELFAQAETIARIADTIVWALKSGGKVLVFGNGGSAADAQHLAAELVGRYDAERAPLPAVALTANTSNLTAISNDYGYREVFARQLEALGRPGDVAIGITTSGRSENVLRAFEAAASAGLVTVCLTGEAGVVSTAVGIELKVRSASTSRVQEAHIAAIHCICELVEREWTC